VIGRIEASTVQEWSQLTGIAPVAQSELVVGIEITQGVDDPSPIAIAYLGVPRPPSPNAPVNRKSVIIPTKSSLFDPFTRK
jgi:hypothetical protein